MNIVIHAKFLSERFPILVEYETENYDIDIVSVRLIRRVVNGGQVYSRPDGAYKLGPVYEAAWLHGQPGCNFILSAYQLCLIEDMVKGALQGPFTSIPEDELVHAEVQ